jgi:hypothetical protein
METKTQIVTQLVAALLSAPQWKEFDYSHIVEIACDVADMIIDTTTEEIPFPETVV